MRKEMPNERICIQSPVWDCIIYPSLSSGDVDLQTFPHPLTTPLLLSAILSLFSLRRRVFLIKIIIKVGFI